MGEGMKTLNVCRNIILGILLLLTFAACENAKTITSDGDNASPNPTPTPPPVRKKVFVSSSIVQGDMLGNGTQGADDECQQLADNANLPGTFKAYLSITGSGIDDLLNNVGPWYLVDNITLAVAVNQFNNPLALITIDQDENGNPPMQNTVWSTTSDSSLNCQSWTDSNVQGSIGYNDGSGPWSEATTESCKNAHHLYCFEQ